FAACEALDPVALQWLLDHGADPNCRGPEPRSEGAPDPGTALDYVIGTYARSRQRLTACIDALLPAGGVTQYGAPALLELLRGRLATLAGLLDADPELVNKCFHELDCGTTGGRALTLKGATLLHVAAEYGNLEAVKLLLDRGAHVDLRAAVDPTG